MLLMAGGAHWALALLLPITAGLLMVSKELRVRNHRLRSIAARRDARSNARRQASEDARITRSFRAILDRVDAPILVFDDAGEIVHANASSATLLGRRTVELVGQTLADLFSQSALINCCERAIGGQPSRARVTLSILASLRTFDASAIPFRSEGASRAVLTLQDVTDLATANRLKTDFVANASHELRTPVAAIKGSVETLEDASEDPAMRERLLSIIARNAARLENLLADLLELGRLESQDVQPPGERFAVAELLNDIASIYESRCRQRALTLEIAVADSAQTVCLNRRLIEVVLSNLMDNATRFADEGTPCIVRVRRVGLGTDHDGAQGQALGTPPGEIRFEVADRGGGIPLGDQSRIFERFYQVSESRSKGDAGGTGLGLSIVKHAVHLLGGRVGVESILHEGSTFWVQVPQADQPADGQARSEPNAPS